VKRWSGVALVVLAVGCAAPPAPAPSPAPPPVPAGWRVVFADDFNHLDTTKWEVSTHTFDGNAARFTPASVDVHDGVLTLTVRKHATGDKAYAAGEVHTRGSLGTFKYGRFEVRMRAAHESGVISSFFAYRASPWDEIDFEFLGRKSRSVQVNLYVSPTEAPVEVPPFPTLHDLAFDASADFHVYAFEWDPGEIRWYVDGVLIDRSNNPGTIPTLPLAVTLNVWPSADAKWAGHLGGGTASASYDWVRVYARTP
jgi:endo-1,3-1,4-beta-glycanase ExoK